MTALVQRVEGDEEMFQVLDQLFDWVQGIGERRYPVGDIGWNGWWITECVLARPLQGCEDVYREHYSSMQEAGKTFTVREALELLLQWLENVWLSEDQCQSHVLGQASQLIKGKSFASRFDEIERQIAEAQRASIEEAFASAQT